MRGATEELARRITNDATIGTGAVRAAGKRVEYPQSPNRVGRYQLEYRALVERTTGKGCTVQRTGRVEQKGRIGIGTVRAASEALEQ